MDARARDLIKIGNSLFSKRSGLMSLWQEVAENCYVERADFTSNRSEGAIFAADLFGSYPLLARRELGNAFGTILRPRNTRWTSIHVQDDKLDKGKPERDYLEFLSNVQWRAIYDPEAHFIDATKQADHDVAAFGNGVIWAGLNSKRSALLHVCHHLRDCAWLENADGDVDAMWRKWSPTARQLTEMYGDKVPQAVKTANDTAPDQTFACFHIAVPQRLYQPDVKPGRKSQPFASLYVEIESNTLLEETGVPWFPYVVPRWAKISGSQYARSPATEIALPDARTFQVMVRTLREAGEKHVDPPMIATIDALRSDIQLFAGGITTVDIEYDERTGEALRPVDSAPGTMPLGFDMVQSTRDDIRLGFFLDKLALPAVDPGKFTAYEFQQRVQQMAREGAPIFEPIEDNYNAPLMQLDYEILRANGAFGGPDLVPDSLRGQQLKFDFRSPLRDAEEQAKTGLFIDGIQRVIGLAATLDPAQKANVQLTAAVQDALRGLGWPEDWISDPKMVAAEQARQAAAAQAQAGMAGVQGLSQTLTGSRGLADLVQPSRSGA